MKLKDILEGCLFTDGDWIESKDQDPLGEIRLIQLADIGDGFFVDKSSRFINRETAKRLRCTFLKKNDLLIARMPDPLGRACVFPLEENEKYVTAVDVCIIRPKENCNNRYLQYGINSTDIRNSIERQKTGTTRERITRKKLGELEIPLPPLPQQQKIAAILDAADVLRQNNKALVAKYDELTQALFLDMFGDPVSNPKGWKKATGKKVFKLIGGAAFKSTDYSNDGIPLIRIGAVNKGYFDKSQLVFLPEDFNSRYEKYLVYPNDLLITLTGTVGKDDYGNAFSLENDFEKYFLNQRVAKITLDEFYNYTFIKFYLKQKRVKSELIGVSRGVRQANISNEDFYKLEVIQPSINIQNQFAERVALIEEQKAIAQKSLEKSEELFNSLLQKAFKGELV